MQYSLFIVFFSFASMILLNISILSEKQKSALENIRKYEEGEEEREQKKDRMKECMPFKILTQNDFMARHFN